MNTISIRRTLQALLPGSVRQAEPWVVQPIGFRDSGLALLASVLDGAGRELGRSLVLDCARGDLVLAEQAFVDQVTPQMLSALVEDRPVITLDVGPARAADTLRRASDIHAQLVRDLRPLGRRDGWPPQAGPGSMPPASGFDSQFDSQQHAQQLECSPLDPDRAQVLNALRLGWLDPAQPLLQVGYGPQASILIDFAVGVAMLDPLAQQHLRISREVPYLARGASPGATATHRQLNLVVWDIALAAGGFRLLHAPVNWWRAPLIAQPKMEVSGLTMLPQHREMARCLAVAPVSPAELRRRCRVSLGDLRGFLQACLFLGLIHWVPSAHT